MNARVPFVAYSVENQPESGASTSTSLNNLSYSSLRENSPKGGAGCDATPLERSGMTEDLEWRPTAAGDGTLAWRDLSVYAKLRGGQLKRIINSVSGTVRTGTLVALMGASGAGKSTLMAALAFRNPVGSVVHGDIAVGGRRTGTHMHRCSGLMHQEDLFSGCLTVHEHMAIMARLKMDRRSGSTARARRVHHLLRALGLWRVRHTTLHNAALSGGEKKRLAFATELLTNPSLLFCDEPTTGLDSSSAQKLVLLMNSMAAEGRTIVCTIHQPSSDLFSMFDKLILLAEGRIAFNGTSKQALQFFSEQGHNCPIDYNPADYFIKILAIKPGSESSCRQDVRRICDQFAVSEVAQQMDIDVQFEFQIVSIDSKISKRVDDFKAPFFHTKLMWLIYRYIMVVIRDPRMQFFKIIQKMVMATAAGLCYVGTVQLSQSGVQAVQGALFIIIAENTFTPMYSILHMFPEEFPLFLRECKAGLYPTSAYYLAKNLAILPGLLVEPFLFVLILYLLAGLRSTIYAFMMTVAMATLVLNVAISCGCFFSCAFGSMPLAIAYLVPFDYSLMVTSGIFIKLSSLPVYVSWLKYLSWLMYANEVMSIIQWDGVDHINCDASKPELPCLRSGKEVLDQYDFNERHFLMNVLIMLVLYASFHLLAYICLRYRSQRR